MSKSIRIAVIVGTRPEAIKLAPLYLELKSSQSISVDLIHTSQHTDLVYDVLSDFSIQDALSLELDRSDNSLSALTIALHNSFNLLYSKQSYDLVIVQGDTTSGMVGALEAFYHKIKVAHVEAGLRTDNKKHPFPEELNRRVISQIADFHYCPTTKNSENLLKENIQGDITVVGNTVIDALKIISNRLDEDEYSSKFSDALSYDSTVLVTAHRRENFGHGIAEIFDSLVELAKLFPETSFICPVHPNSNVRDYVHQLELPESIFLFKPLSYKEIIYLYSKVVFVMTDSGGIQEEAPGFGLPIIVMRETTERMEIIESGNGMLTGASKAKIVVEASKLLTDETYRSSFALKNNPYGNGTTSKQIRESIETIFDIV